MVLVKREIKTDAVVLESEDSGEADRIVTLLTLSNGKIKAKMKGVKRAKAKLSYASFPFNFGEYMLVQTGRSFTVTNCSYIDNFSALTYDLNRYYAGAGVLEIANHQSKEGDDAVQLFLLLVKTLKALNYNEDANIFAVLSKFLVEILEISGFKLTSLQNQDNGKFFDFSIGRLSGQVSEEMIELQEDDATILDNLINTDFEEYDQSLKVSKTVLKLLILFYENKVDEEIKILKKFI